MKTFKMIGVLLLLACQMGCGQFAELTQVAIEGSIATLGAANEEGRHRRAQARNQRQEAEDQQMTSTGPCAGVTCSDRGHCTVLDGAAMCSCENGYHSAGSECLTLEELLECEAGSQLGPWSG